MIELWHYFALAFGLALGAFQIYLVFQLLLSQRDVTSIYSWLIVLILLPGLGVVIYYLFGRYKKEFNIMDTRSKSFIENDLVAIFSPLLKKQTNYSKILENEDTKISEKKIARLGINNSSSLVTFNNKVKILQDGDKKFPELIEDLKHAQKFIHMEYYIWRKDSLTKEIVEILKAKAREGVEVRILFDAIGSIFFSFHWLYIREIRKAGIEIYPFLKIIHIHAWNYRNHRKIVVIDCNKGFIGGMNMGKEHVDGGKNFESWRDTHLKIEGDAVNLLQKSFSISWHITTGKSLGKQYFQSLDLKNTDDIPVQVLLSGPDADNESIKQLYFSLITTASKRIYIQTPYFIPDTTMLESLIFAANSGIDVRIMIAGEADIVVWQWAAMPYLEALAEAGVKVYFYRRGFLHSKVLIADSSLCSVGTANFDIRSFRIDYEINCVVYDVNLAKQLEDDFNKDVLDCEEYTLDTFKRISLLAKVRNAFSRLLSPLL